ncbi:MAG: hypothetical protein KUG81_03225 [Gammaproteobacteria bacterium]|nr:hypothetical protein [Gammaproteobacteria bacterium]
MASSNEVIVKSCLFFQDIGCYDLLKDFSGPVLTVAVAFLGIKYAFKQLDAQHQNTLDAQKEEVRRHTKIELFKKISTLLEKSSASMRDVGTYCLTQRIIQQFVVKNDSPPMTIEEYQAILKQFSDALLEMISIVESHEIVHFKLFRVFRYSLQSISHELMKLRKEGKRDVLLGKVWHLVNDAQCYLGDFQVCIQNMAYGDIFEHKVPHRVAVDKSSKVIVDDLRRLANLEKYFLKETEWGKSIAAAEMEAVEKYHS